MILKMLGVFVTAKKQEVLFMIVKIMMNFNQNDKIYEFDLIY